VVFRSGDSVIVSDTNPTVDPRNDLVQVTSARGGFVLERSWQVVGGAPGDQTSAVLKHIMITNNSSAQTAFHYFHVGAFHAKGSLTGNIASILGPAFDTASVTDGVAQVTQTTSLVPSRYQVSPHDTIVTAMDDVAVNDLSNAAGPPGPGNLDIAFQWDFQVPIGQSVTLDITDHVAPVPSPTGAVVVAAAMLGRRRRNPTGIR
jgi:hypothetical protein